MNNNNDFTMTKMSWGVYGWTTSVPAQPTLLGLCL